jgi:RNA polymerase sigma-70 factor, ECF subfamily
MSLWQRNLSARRAVSRGEVGQGTLRREGDPTQRLDEVAERRLVQRAKEDPQAFGQLYDLYFERIHAFIHRRTGDRQTAEDLTSDTFYKALANIRKYEYTGQPFSSWLFRIASNVVTDFYRAKRPAASIDEWEGMQLPAAGAGPEEAALAAADALVIQQAVRTLSPDQQEVIALRFTGGLRLKEIADMLGKTEGAVKALMFRAIANLRGRLSEGEVQR